MNTESQVIPLGTQSFRTMRSCNEVYVDKTRMVFELARYRKKYFLARPRRFGKSLLVSTFASLFSEGLKHFNGLEIEKLWNDKTYDVVSLSFSIAKGCSDPNEFRSLFEGHLVASFAKAGFVFDIASNVPVLAQISSWLDSRPANSLVLLIDEYDAPLTNSLGKRELFDNYQQTMSRFFEVMKQNEGCLRFFFMTGITRFSNTGIFSGFNSIRDISLDSRYGELLGYTREEINEYFGYWLDAAQEKHGLTREGVLDRLQAEYDGFCFDDHAATHVYCPWSVLSFFDDYLFRFDKYWFQSGGHPSVLLKYLAIHQLQKPMDLMQSVRITRNDLLSTVNYEDLQVEVLLHQAGYLTIGRVIEDGVFELRYPNNEVASSMSLLYIRTLLKRPHYDLTEISLALQNADFDACSSFVTAAFESIPYDDHAVRDESVFRIIMQYLLMGSGAAVSAEKHSALGRSDLECVINDVKWVFELKFAKRHADVGKLLEAAANQIVLRRYGSGLPLTKKTMHVAVVFDSENRIPVFKEVGKVMAS